MISVLMIFFSFTAEFQSLELQISQKAFRNKSSRKLQHQIQEGDFFESVLLQAPDELLHQACTDRNAIFVVTELVKKFPQIMLHKVTNNDIWPSFKKMTHQVGGIRSPKVKGYHLLFKAEIQSFKLIFFNNCTTKIPGNFWIEIFIHCF